MSGISLMVTEKFNNLMAKKTRPDARIHLNNFAIAHRKISNKKSQTRGVDLLGDLRVNFRNKTYCGFN